MLELFAKSIFLSDNFVAFSFTAQALKVPAFPYVILNVVSIN